jgi:hypothetical protein
MSVNSLPLDSTAPLQSKALLFRPPALVPCKLEQPRRSLEILLNRPPCPSCGARTSALAPPEAPGRRPDRDGGMGGAMRISRKATSAVCVVEGQVILRFGIPLFCCQSQIIGGCSQVMRTAAQTSLQIIGDPDSMLFVSLVGCRTAFVDGKASGIFVLCDQINGRREASRCLELGQLLISWVNMQLVFS